MEGTAAHFLLEKCLTEGSSPFDFLGRTLTVSQDRTTREFVITKDMASDVLYSGVNPVRDIALRPGISRVEVKARCAHIDPDLHGRCDVWHFGDDGWLTIFDYKYGRIDVSPERNSQLLIYLDGIYREHIEPLGRAVNGVRLIIGQPRSLSPGPRVKEWTCSLEDLLDFELELRVAVHELRTNPHFRLGPWCKYCPALGDCPASQDAISNIAPILLQADIGANEAGKILALKDLLEKKIKTAQAVAEEALLKGQKVDGYFLATECKHRQWRDEDMAREAVLESVGVSALKLPTPAQVETFGADAKAITDRLAFTPPGGPTLARAGDKRAPYIAKSTAQMFAGT